MKTKLITTMMIVLFLASIAAIATPVGAPLPSVVWVPTQYLTIQQGIDAVAEGGTVYVLSGTYYEHVVITKPLTLAGMWKATTIIDGSGSGNVVEVKNTHDVKITGFTIQNAGVDGIYLEYVDHSKLTNLDVHFNGRHGIFTQHSPYIVIANVDTHSNNVMNNPYDPGNGIALGWIPSHNIIKGVNAYSNWQGITVYDWPENVTIKDCNVYSNTHQGIILGWTTGGVVSNCKAWSNGEEGIKLEASSFSTVKDCVSTSNGQGIGIAVWGYNTIRNCRASNNLGSGFYISSAYSNTIEKCVSSSNGYGIALSGGFWRIWTQDNVITENVVSENGVGIGLYAPLAPDPKYCKDNSIYHNNIVKNTQQAYDDAESTAWDNGYPSGGNYWSDYRGLDLYKGPDQNILGPDGIGDAPYNIPGAAGSQDRYPFMMMSGWKLKQWIP